MTIGSEELNIFAGINFREWYQIKYFAVPNFRGFCKKLRNRETLYFISHFHHFYHFILNLLNI